MTQPIRIQRKRTKGYDMQAASRVANGLECVYVGRPSKFGNPYTNATKFRHWLFGDTDLEINQTKRSIILRDLSQLRGRNLVCWCNHDFVCHADVLLELANR